MTSKNRTYNSISNSLYGIISYFIILVVTFASRKVFALSLGEEYLGLNSLFSNFVTMLSLPELGLSTAMLFFLYKPVANRDTIKINSFLNYYKKIYRFISIGITITGLFFSFFLGYFVHSEINPHIIQIYFLFQSNPRYAGKKASAWLHRCGYLRVTPATRGRKESVQNH